MNALGRFSSGALEWFVRTSWQAAVLVLAVLVLERFLGRRLSPRWRYGLWWIVVARLILPPLSLPGVHLTLPPPLARERASLDPAHALPNAPPVRPAGGAVERGIVPLAAPVPPDPAPEASAALPIAPPAPPETVAADPPLAVVLAGLWLLGALTLAVAAAVRDARLFRRLARDPRVEEPELLEIVERCRREAGVRRGVTAVRSGAVQMPAMVGYYRPLLVLPDTAGRVLTPAQFEDVVRHEMEHLAHHDAAANWFLHAVLCVHFANPFAWFALARLRADRETVRDLGVFRRDPRRSPCDYGRTILRVAASASHGMPRPAVVGILGTRGNVKRRIAVITACAGRPAHGFLTGLVLALALAAATLVLASEPPPPAAPAGPAPPASPAAGKVAVPRALVVGFEVTGDTLEKEHGLTGSLDVLAEAILAKRFATISGPDADAACEGHEAKAPDLRRDPDLRLAVAKELGVAACVTGWACSFGERVVLIVEVIDPVRGLPGAVHRRACVGVAAIPEALEELLAEAVPSSSAPLPEAAAAGPGEEATEDVEDLLAAIPEDDLLDTWPDEAYVRLLALRNSGPESLTPIAAGEVERLLAEVREHARRLHEDPAYRAEWTVRTNVRLDAALSGFEFEVLSRPPNLLFVERTPRGASFPEAPAYADVLARLHAEFRRAFASGEALPPSPEGVLRAIVFTAPGSMARYQKSIGQPLPAGFLSYYSPRDRGLVVDAAGAGSVPGGSARERLVHGGFHQLAHAYSRAAQSRERGEEVSFDDPALAGRSLWIEEGLAELFAAASSASGGDFDFLSTAGARLAELRGALAAPGRPMWTLLELLRVGDAADLRRTVEARHLPPAEASGLTSLFHAESWGFCHFLWNHEDGEHRAKLLAAFGQELLGRTGYRSWRAVWDKAAEDDDWSGLESEWRGYLAGL